MEDLYRLNKNQPFIGFSENKICLSSLFKNIVIYSFLFLAEPGLAYDSD